LLDFITNKILTRLETGASSCFNEGKYHHRDIEHNDRD
jgi:hypothetical protein